MRKNSHTAALIYQILPVLFHGQVKLKRERLVVKLHRLRKAPSREDYDKWRYNYPKYDENSGYVKVPSRALSNEMIEVFKDRLKND